MDDESQVIATMGVSVECVAALRAVQRELEMMPEEERNKEEEEEDDLDTDEELWWTSCL